MDNLLYYPHVNIPESDWSIRTLLYYDTIGAIVPQRFLNGDTSYDPFMRELVDSKLVVPINPMNCFGNSHKVTRPFLNYLHSDELSIKKRRKDFEKEIGLANGSRRRENQLSEIYGDKFDYEIFYQLKDAGLAKNIEHDKYIVEKKTASELMTFIASVIGVNLNYLPVTSKLKREKFQVVGLGKKDFRIHKLESKKREMILEELLPFPERIDLNKLGKFKDKHNDLLRAFRNKVELIVFDPTIEQESDLLVQRIEELRLRKEELTAKMNENKLGVSRFMTLSGIAGPIQDLTAETAVGKALGVLSFTGAILSAIAMEKPDHIFDQSGLKYLALVENQLRKPV